MSYGEAKLTVVVLEPLPAHGVRNRAALGQGLAMVSVRVRGGDTSVLKHQWLSKPILGP